MTADALEAILEGVLVVQPKRPGVPRNLASAVSDIQGTLASIDAQLRRIADAMEGRPPIDTPFIGPVPPRPPPPPSA